MSNSYTPNLGLAIPATGDRAWNVPLSADLALLDAQAPIGALGVQTTESPSTTLNVKVAAGNYVLQDGTIATYAGTSSKAIASNSTVVLYLDLAASGALTTAGSYPATPHVRIATVVTTGTAIAQIADNRVALTVIGSIADGVNVTFGTVAGTKIGSAANQRLGFWGATPIAQPSGANQGLITDSTSGTASFTLGAVGATNSGDVSGSINNNFATLARSMTAMRLALVAAGLMKGSA